MDNVKRISRDKPASAATILTRLPLSSEKCWVINQVTRGQLTAAGACLTTSRLHYPAARSKVVISNLAAFLGTMLSVQALIKRLAGAPTGGWGFGNFDVNMD
jgi:hypothetical protein